MKKILVTLIVLIYFSLNAFATQEGYYKKQVLNKISEEIKKSDSQIKKHIQNGGMCGEEKLFKDVIKGKEISINLIQKKIDDRYKGYLTQLDNYTKKEDKLYKDLEKLKISYEKANNISDDYKYNTGDYNWDLVSEENRLYDLKSRKSKEIAKVIKEHSKYIEDFDKSDLFYYQNKKEIKNNIISGITEKCIEMKEEIKPKKKTLTENTKKVNSNYNVIISKKTKLELKQEKLRKKIIELHKKIPKKIESLYPMVLKFKTKLKKGTDKYALVETIEKTIYELMNK